MPFLYPDDPFTDDLLPFAAIDDDDTAEVVPLTPSRYPYPAPFDGDLRTKQRQRIIERANAADAFDSLRARHQHEAEVEDALREYDVEADIARQHAAQTGVRRWLGDKLIALGLALKGAA